MASTLNPQLGPCIAIDGQSYGCFSLWGLPSGVGSTV